MITFLEGQIVFLKSGSYERDGKTVNYTDLQLLIKPATEGGRWDLQNLRYPWANGSAPASVSALQLNKPAKLPVEVTVYENRMIVKPVAA